MISCWKTPIKWKCRRETDNITKTGQFQSNCTHSNIFINLYKNFILSFCITDVCSKVFGQYKKQSNTFCITDVCSKAFGQYKKQSNTFCITDVCFKESLVDI